MIVRPAAREDVPSLVALIGALADYERQPDAVEIDEQMLADALFADAPVVFANVADDAGAIAGMTVYFRNYSTWTGKLGIYLEDFYVCPEVRGRGVGRALMAALAEEARAHGYARIDWSVLDWNETALGFYTSIGAKPMTGWTGYRLDGDALARFGLDGS
jgi:GNAT superfamily N-acetyltransferase